MPCKEKGNNNYRSARFASRKYADAERIVHKSRAFNRCLKATLLRKRRRKERIALHLEIAMSIATYRGVKYDTETHQANFKTWWNRIHCDASRWLTYRGNRYRGTKECQL
jgi:hypothetical protein